MGLVQSVEGPHRTERQRNGNSLWLEVGSPASPVFGRGVSFFDGFQRPPVSGCSTASCNFGALAGGDELTSFYCAMLNLNPRSEF